MVDERTLLERRVAWLEVAIVRLIWAAIGIASFGAGAIVYAMTVNHVGSLVAFGLGVVVWLMVGWYLHHIEFRGAPEHVKLMDP
jgi:hypothetical protein